MVRTVLGRKDECLPTFRGLRSLRGLFLDSWSCRGGRGAFGSRSGRLCLGLFNRRVGLCLRSGSFRLRFWSRGFSLSFRRRGLGLGLSRGSFGLGFGCGFCVRLWGRSRGSTGALGLRCGSVRRRSGSRRLIRGGSFFAKVSLHREYYWRTTYQPWVLRPELELPVSLQPPPPQEQRFEPTVLRELQRPERFQWSFSLTSGGTWLSAPSSTAGAHRELWM